MKIFKIKSGMEDQLLKWGRELSGSLRKEALQSLEEEQCEREFFYLFRLGTETYVAAHMEGKTILPATDSKLNQKHRSILRQCIEREVSLQEVYDLRV